MSHPNADKSTPKFAPGHQGVAKVMPQSKLRQAGLLLGKAPKEAPKGVSRRPSYMGLRGTKPYACFASNGCGELGGRDARKRLPSLERTGSMTLPFGPKM